MRVEAFHGWRASYSHDHSTQYGSKSLFSPCSSRFPLPYLIPLVALLGATSLGTLSLEGVSPFQQKRTHEQPEDMTTSPGRGEMHHS
jgi:hypothetical protein